MFVERQGGSVARSLLLNPSFHVRCIIRSTTSAKARDLVELGAKIVQAQEFNDEALLSAFSSWRAFVYTQTLKIPVCSIPPRCLAV
jgi:hypothetical protein